MKDKVSKRIEMIKRGEVPKGYKLTKFGIQPDDWEEMVFCNLFREKSELTSDTDRYPLYSLTIEKGVTPKTDRYEREFLITKVGDCYKIVQNGDFVFNPMNARFGAIAYYRGNFPVAVSGYYNVFGIIQRYDSTYIKYFLLSERMFNHYNAMAVGSLIEKRRIHFSQFLEFKVPIPPAKEANEIGRFLWTWDRAIELKEKLLEQKKLQKKGLMERLLIGKMRLPGFNDLWIERRLGDLLKERRETGYPSLELLSITAQNGVIRRESTNRSDTSSKDKSKYKRIMPFDIGYNTMRMWQGVSGVSEFEGIVSPAYTVVKPIDSVDPHFMGYLFKHPKMINMFWRNSQGLVDDTLNLKYENFKKIHVSIPADIAEQRSIANLLIRTDFGLEKLGEEIEALKIQKKGLMQLLLTGKVRVPLEEEVP